MSKRNSDWYIPPDLLPILGMCFVLPAIPCRRVVVALGCTIEDRGIANTLWFWIGSGLMGAVLLFIARLPLYRQRDFDGSGPEQLDREHRRIYWLAYVFFAASLLLFASCG